MNFFIVTFSIVLLLLFSVVVINSYEIDLNFQTEVAEGEKYYGELIKKSQSYGDCWKKAVSDLQSSCRSLTEEKQSRLALSFSNCFLKHAGRDISPCSTDESVSDCLKNISDQAFSTYTEFFTHTQSVCHYLQHRQWQEETAKTVLVLTENSRTVSKKLDETSKSQSRILDLQQTSIREQKQLISSGKILNAELQKSRDNAKDLYNEFKSSTSEQRHMLFEVFDRMKSLQNIVLGEFNGVFTVVYYVIAVVLSYILTSVPRTAGARIWLIFVISLNAMIERALTSSILQDDAQVNLFNANELLYERIWLCRKIAAFICFIILMVSYHRYKDYNAINYELLRQIQEQTANLQQSLKELTFHENMQSYTAVLKSSVDQISLLEGIREKTTSNGDVNEKKTKNTTRIKPLQQILDENINDKENRPSISSISTTIIKDDIQVTTNTKSPSQKKSSVSRKTNILSKSQGNTPKTPRSPALNGSILSNLESPISPSSGRYNLRSSRVNSPQLSPYMKN